MFRIPITEFIAAENRFYFWENPVLLRAITTKNPDVPQKIAKVRVTLAMS